MSLAKPPIPFESGQLLAEGRYRITSVLREGRWSQTLAAIVTQTQRAVVLKTIRATQADQVEAQRQYFQFLWQRLGHAQHPHYQQVLNYFEVEQRPFLVLEAIPGRSLATQIKRQPLPEATALLYIRQIAQAVQSIHARGALHRDIKPANIRYHAQSKTVVLADFGCLPVPAGAATTAYAAPEIASQVTPRSDVYGLAATLYTLLTGAEPAQIDAQTAIPPVYSAVTQQAIAKGLAREPAARSASVADWLALLPTDLHQTQAGQVAPTSVELLYDSLPDYATSATRTESPYVETQQTEQPQNNAAKRTPVTPLASASPAAIAQPQPLPVTSATAIVTPSQTTMNSTPNTIRRPLHPGRILAGTGICSLVLGLGIGFTFQYAPETALPKSNLLQREQTFPERDWPGSTGPDLPDAAPFPERAWYEEPSIREPQPLDAEAPLSEAEPPLEATTDALTNDAAVDPLFPDAATLDGQPGALRNRPTPDVTTEEWAPDTVTFGESLPAEPRELEPQIAPLDTAEPLSADTWSEPEPFTEPVPADTSEALPETGSAATRREPSE